MGSNGWKICSIDFFLPTICCREQRFFLIGKNSLNNGLEQAFQQRAEKRPGGDAMRAQLVSSHRKHAQGVAFSVRQDRLHR